MNTLLNSLSANITVELNGIVAITHYQLTYTNETSDPIEALYHMALPRMSSVMSCEVTVGDQSFTAKLARKEDAAAEYEDAITDGNRTVLLESLRDGLYALNIGNLAPYESIVIELEIAQLLTAGSNGETLTYTLPTTIAPTYGVSQNNVEPEHNLFARYPFTATIKCSEPINVLTSSHPVVNASGKQQFAGLMDRDIFFCYAAQTQGRLYAGSYGGANYVLGYPQVNCLEAEDDKQACAELHLVIDRSGSMNGESINLCKTALKQLLSEIEPQTLVNITSFGSKYERLFTTAQPYSGDHKKQVRQYLDLLAANMGGTELESAVIGSLKDIEYSPTVSHMIIITDGLVNLSKESFASIELLCHQRNVVIHSVGVGFSVNQQVVSQLAELRDGISATVNPNAELLNTIKGMGRAIEQSYPISAQRQTEETGFFHYPQRYYQQAPQILMAQGKSLNLQTNSSIHFDQTVIVDEHVAKAIVQLATLKKMPSLSRSEATSEAEQFEILTQYTSFIMVDTTSVVENSEDLKTVVVPQQQKLSSLSTLQSVSPYHVSSESSCYRSSSHDSVDSTHTQADKGLDTKIFLRKAAPESINVEPEAGLLRDMNRTFWDPDRWTPEFLARLQFSSTFIDSLSAIGDIYAVPFSTVVLAYLSELIKSKETTITSKAKRRLSKTTLAMSPDLLEEVQGLVGAETFEI